MNHLTKQFLYILGLSIVFGFIRYLNLEDYKLVDSGNSEVFTDNIQMTISPPGPWSLNIEDAKEMYDNNSGIFIDARDAEEFNEGHIANALNIPYENKDYDLLDSLVVPIAPISDEGSMQKFESGYFIEKFLVIYCSGEGCSLSEDLAYELSESYRFHSDVTVYYFEEGFSAWKDLGYPIKVSNLDVLQNDTESKKSLLNFIDYMVVFSILLIFIFYFNDSYKHLIPILSRMVLGFIFIYFSWDKILDPRLFGNVIKNYDIVPFGFENLIALFLPYIEFLIGAFLILGIFLDISVVISTSLLIMFILMISQAYLRGKSIDCGCLLSDLSDSSSSEKRMYMLKRIVQDICFIVYAIIVKYRIRFKRDK